MFFADIVGGVDRKLERGPKAKRYRSRVSGSTEKNLDARSMMKLLRCNFQMVVSYQGENGVLELFIEGDFADTFEVSPSVVENSAQFVVSVKNSKKIDYEELQTIEFKVIFKGFASKIRQQAICN